MEKKQNKFIVRLFHKGKLVGGGNMHMDISYDLPLDELPKVAAYLSKFSKRLKRSRDKSLITKST